MSTIPPPLSCKGHILSMVVDQSTARCHSPPLHPGSTFVATQVFPATCETQSPNHEIGETIAIY
jgi:hypothetical protein